jgi:integrase
MKNGIAKRGSKYSYTLRIPDPVTGKTKPKWVGGFQTEQEAKIALAKAKVALSNGSYIAPTKITLEDFLREWVEVHSLTLSEKIAEDYRTMIETKIIPRLGKIVLTQLKPSHIQKFYGELRECGAQDGGALSARSVAYIGTVLKTALKYAVEVEGILSVNIATRVAVPKGEARRLEPWSVEELKVFLAGISEHRLFALYRFAVFSGARKGEIVALKWSDLDFERGTISISKNRLYFNHKTIEQNRTKGGDGRRVISLDPETLDILRSHRKRQFEERLGAGEVWKESGNIFVTVEGDPIHYSTPTAVFARYRKKLGLREQRFHDLRHLHATQLLQNETPLHVVSKRLGHSQVMTTASIYAHVTTEQEKKASLTFAKAVE